MEGSTNLLGSVAVALTVGLPLVALAALLVGVRARAGGAADASRLPGWQLTLLAAVVAALLVQAATFTVVFLR